eukprot:11227110-Lingulodinium_polyedra.AAC.1
MTAGFRFSPAALTAAKQAHIAAERTWMQAPCLAAREGRRASARGLGPPNRARPAPLEGCFAALGRWPSEP